MSLARTVHGRSSTTLLIQGPKSPKVVTVA